MTHRIQVILIALCCFALVPAHASGKRAFQLDDLYRIKSISALTASPDGRTIVCQVTSFQLKKGKRNTDLYRLNRDTGRIDRLTFSTASDYAPAFSPDGSYLYFLSTRNEGAQVWRMAVDGGEPEQVTHVPTGVDSFHVLPDGHTLIFSSHVFPECGADADCNRTYMDRLEKGPVQAHFADTLLFRHWNRYRDWRYSHLFRLDLRTGDVVALTSGTADYPTYGGSFTVSPDGLQLCTTINPDEQKATSTNSDLYVIDLGTDKRRNLTQSNPAYDGNPAYSPDGRYIAYRMQKVPGYESDRFRLVVYDRQRRQSIFLTERLDNWVQSIEWGPHSKAIYFTVHENGRVPLYRVMLADGKIERVVDTSFIREFKVLPDGAIVFTRSSVGEPYEIWQLDPEPDAQPRQITWLNRDVTEEVDIRPAESMWIPGADGRKIHTYIVKPHNFDPAKKYPLILNVHGGPQYQWADSFRGDWQVYPGAGYIVAFPNPHGSTGYGQEFTAAISRDYDGKVMKDINKVADALAALPFVDEDRMGAMGWSWGGYAMMWLEGHNRHFKALVAMMGIFDLSSMYYATEELWFPEWDNGGAPWENPEYYRRASPSTYVENFQTPCLVITGERDYRVPYTQSLQFFTALQKRGVPSELIVFANDGHWPDTVKSMPVYYNAHLEWFHRYLGGAPAPYDTRQMIRNLAFEEDPSSDN